MKTKFLLLISQIVFLSCQSSNSETDKTASRLPEVNTDNWPVEATPPNAQTAPNKENKEYLAWEKIRINGKIPLITSVKRMEELLGKADSVISINWNETCSSNYKSEASQDAYFKGMEFEQFGDSLSFQLVNFQQNHNVFLQIGNLKLDHNTTLAELKKHFPLAVKDISKNFYLIDGKNTDAVNLPPSKELADGQWILMFQEGKLIRIDNWFPC